MDCRRWIDCVFVFDMFKKWLCKLFNDGAGSKSDNGLDDQYESDFILKDAALR